MKAERGNDFAWFSLTRLFVHLSAKVLEKVADNFFEKSVFDTNKKQWLHFGGDDHIPWAKMLKNVFLICKCATFSRCQRQTT